MTSPTDFLRWAAKDLEETSHGPQLCTFVVFVATQARQDELDAKYGPDLIRLEGWFEPLD